MGALEYESPQIACDRGRRVTKRPPSGSERCAVAFLELPAGPARTRIVAPNRRPIDVSRVRGRLLQRPHASGADDGRVLPRAHVRRRRLIRPDVEYFLRSAGLLAGNVLEHAERVVALPRCHRIRTARTGTVAIRVARWLALRRRRTEHELRLQEAVGERVVDVAH